MREILFRGKKLDPVTLKPTDEWVEGYFMRGAIDGIYMIQEENKRCHIVDSETIDEYTGLTDKNGKKIFEGDVLEYEFGDIGKQRAVIRWSEKYAAFLLDVITHNFQYTDKANGKIIGNIHDNRELLETGV